uniref:Uncharacterized protein n=1 Tax=Alexandrium andersonii TaxID=327968 RepID=A0A7S2BIG9_9DINO
MARVVAMVACLACLSGSAHACSAEMQQMSDCSGTGTVTRTLAIPVVATAPGSACQYQQKDVYCDANLTYHRTLCSGSSDCTSGCQHEWWGAGVCQGNVQFVCAPSCSATTTVTATATTFTATTTTTAMVTSGVTRHAWRDQITFLMLAPILAVNAV